MEELLKSEEFMAIVNNHRRDKERTPNITTLPDIYTEDTSDSLFDISTNTRSAPPSVRLVIPNKISTFVFDNG